MTASRRRTDELHGNTDLGPAGERGIDGNLEGLSGILRHFLGKSDHQFEVLAWGSFTDFDLGAGSIAGGVLQSNGVLGLVADTDGVGFWNRRKLNRKKHLCGSDENFRLRDDDDVEFDARRFFGIGGELDGGLDVLVRKRWHGIDDDMEFFPGNHFQDASGQLRHTGDRNLKLERGLQLIDDAHRGGEFLISVGRQKKQCGEGIDLDGHPVNPLDLQHKIRLRGIIAFHEHRFNLLALQALAIEFQGELGLATRGDGAGVIRNGGATACGSFHQT
jgi:hypothetical protein